MKNLLCVILFSLFFVSFVQAEKVRVGVLLNGSETRIQYKQLAYPFLLNEDVDVTRLSSIDIASGKLSGYDVLYISAVRQSNSAHDELLVSLNSQGLSEIRQFVTDGGIYIGDGIGARLALNKEALAIAEGEMKYYPYRRISAVKIAEGQKVLTGYKKDKSLFTYMDHISWFPSVKDSRTLLSRVITHKNGKKENRPVLVSTALGKGKVYLGSFSLHKATGFNWALAKISNPEKSIRNTYSSAIMKSARSWDEELQKREKSLSRTLKSALAYDSEKLIKAINEVHRDNHIALIPYVVSCLRNQHAAVRKRTAEIILERMYAAGLDDLEQVFKLEVDGAVKAYLKSVLDKLNLDSPRKLPKFTGNDNVKVAVYSDLGVGGYSWNSAMKLVNTLKIDSAFESVIIGAVEVDEGFLDKVDVIIFPGGSASGIGGFLGYRGIREIQDFVRKKKGGYLGICAGAYLGTSHYKWSLGLLNAGCFDTNNWARGQAMSQVKTENVKGLFPELVNQESLFQGYMQGPLMVKGKNPEFPAYESVMSFISDVAKNSDIAGATPGKDYVIKSKDESGQKVILCSGHPETTPGARYYIPRMVRWLAGRDLIEYPQKFVDNKKFKKFYMLDKKWKSEFQKDVDLILKLSDEKAVLRGLSGLERSGFKGDFLIQGVLRSQFASVRIKAAELIIKQNILSAVDDVELALKQEKDPDASKALNKVMDYLSK